MSSERNELQDEHDQEREEAGFAPRGEPNPYLAYRVDRDIYEAVVTRAERAEAAERELRDTLGRVAYYLQGDEWGDVEAAREIVMPFEPAP